LVHIARNGIWTCTIRATTPMNVARLSHVAEIAEPLTNDPIVRPATM